MVYSPAKVNGSSASQHDRSIRGFVPNSLQKFFVRTLPATTLAKEVDKLCLDTLSKFNDCIRKEIWDFRNNALKDIQMSRGITYAPNIPKEINQDAETLISRDHPFLTTMIFILI